MLTSDHAVEALRDAGMRLTPQRRALIDVLSGNTAHPSAEQVADDLSSRLPGVSLTTVYKVLHEFAELGLVRELDLPGSMRFDPETADHAHLVCSGCGDVLDLDLTGMPAAMLSLPSGARVDRVDVTVYGRCEGCSAS